MSRFPELIIRPIAESPGVERSGQWSVTIGTRHLSVGRAPDNDIVIPDSDISRHHALVWSTDEGVFVRDLGSANGSFIEGERIHEIAPLPYGATLRLGSRVELEARAPVDPGAFSAKRALALEDQDSGTRWPLHSDRFRVGRDAMADLRVDCPEDQEAVLLIYANGEVWLGRDEDDCLVAVGDAFKVGEMTLRLVEIDPVSAPTSQPDTDRYLYRLKVGLDGPGGPLAEISHMKGGPPHSINAENRVVLMYLLARKAIEDREAGLGVDDRGWCNDDDIVVGIWGKGALSSGGNRLKVLVHRVRKELKEDGFEPWCIEKRSGLIRGRFAAFDLG